MSCNVSSCWPRLSDYAIYMLDADGYVVSAAHPELDVSTYHLTVEIASTYESMCIFPPAEHLPCAQGDPPHLLQRPLSLADQPQTTGHPVSEDPRPHGPTLAMSAAPSPTPTSPLGGSSRHRTKDIEGYEPKGSNMSRCAQNATGP